MQETHLEGDDLPAGGVVHSRLFLGLPRLAAAHELTIWTFDIRVEGVFQLCERRSYAGAIPPALKPSTGRRDPIFDPRLGTLKQAADMAKGLPLLLCLSLLVAIHPARARRYGQACLYSAKPGT